MIQTTKKCRVFFYVESTGKKALAHCRAKPVSKCGMDDWVIRYFRNVTIPRLERVIGAFEDQGRNGYAGGDFAALLSYYDDMLSVREDLRKLTQPIGGRFIGPEDRLAVDHALDALHSAIMWRYEADERAVHDELEKLLEYLSHVGE